jgi:hypothetical protein
MTIEEILKAFAHKDNNFPREALEQATAQKDEITPHLLKILEKVADNPDEILEQEDYSFLYALFLLAQFRETKAYPLVVRIASLPPKTVDALLGDTITEGLPKILASVCGGDLSLIKQLAENPKAEEFARGSAFIALTALVASGDASREEVMRYYSELFDAKLKEKPSEEVVMVLTDLVNCASDIYPRELYDRIKTAFEKDLIDDSVVDLDWVNEKMGEGKESVLDELRANRHIKLVENAIEEMEWWAWYKEPSENDIDLSVEEIMEVFTDDDLASMGPALRQAVAKKDEIIPLLLRSVERAANHPAEVLEEGDHSFAYAIYLLAEFREKRAYPLIVQLASAPPELMGDLLGSISSEDLHNILASVSWGDTSLIAELAVNTKADANVRAAAIRSWLTLVVAGEKSREEVMAYYKSLFEGGLKDKNEVVWSELVDCAADLYPEEVYEQIKKAFEDPLIDNFLTDLDWVNYQMELGKDRVLEMLPEINHLIEDAALEMEWWVLDGGEDEEFEGDEDEDDEEVDRMLRTYHQLFPGLNGHGFEPQTPYVAPEKIGRNEPCPCGSGKKYKKCCGA